MQRMPNVRPITYAVVVGVTLAAAGIAWLFGTVVADGHELSQIEDMTLDVLIGSIILLTLGWLVLRHQSRGRKKYQQEIDAERKKLDTAISHMSQGLVMFDASCRIVFCNRRYMELYDVSPSIVRPGLSFRELLIHRRDNGSFFGDVDEYCTMMANNVAQRKTTNLVVDSSGGRTVRIVNVPLEEGGWVATHEDITERQQLLDAHERSEKIVSEQKLQLDVALNNMTHGLCMFDAGGPYRAIQSALQRDDGPKRRISARPFAARAFQATQGRGRASAAIPRSFFPAS